MGPIWGRQDPGGSHVGPMNFAIWERTLGKQAGMKQSFRLEAIFHALYGAVCIQLTHVSCDDCENMCTLSHHHYQIGSMTHLPLFRVRSWNNGIHCMSFYILKQRLWCSSWNMSDNLIHLQVTNWHDIKLWMVGFCLILGYHLVSACRTMTLSEISSLGLKAPQVSRVKQ